MKTFHTKLGFLSSIKFRIFSGIALMLLIVILVQLNRQDEILSTIVKSQSSIQTNSFNTVRERERYIDNKDTPIENREYYVSPTGNDTNSGSIESPWKTFSKANASIEPGDTVYLRGGTYTEQLIITKGGTASNLTSFLAYPGEVPIIDGSEISLYQSSPPGSELLGMIFVNDQSYVRVKGIKVINSSLMGISAWCSDGNHSIYFEDNTTEYTNSSGVAIWECDDAFIRHNTVRHGGLKNKPPYHSQENIVIVGADRFEISYNTVENSGTSTIDNGIEGIDAKDGTSNGSIHHNTVQNIPYRLGIYVDAATRESHDVHVYSNVVSNTQGIVVSPEMGGNLHDVFVYDNTVRNTRLIGSAVGVGVGWGNPYQSMRRLRNIKVYNNIIDGIQVGIYIHGVAFTANATQSFQDIFLYNNTITNTSYSGILVDTELTNNATISTIDIQNVLIANNTIQDRMSDYTNIKAGIKVAENSFSSAPGGVRIINNIVMSSAPSSLSTNTAPIPKHILIIDPQGRGGFTAVPFYTQITHNLLYPPKNGGQRGKNVITENPQLTQNLELSNSSPAINAGIQLNEVLYDRKGTTRPQGGRYDIGSYEMPSASER